MSRSGNWGTVEVAGHRCDTFEPTVSREPARAVIYLHDRHLTPLADNAAYTAQFEQHGLRVIAPQSGCSWWTDRIWAEFDPAISAERYVIDRILPWIEAHWGARPPLVALLGTGMGGQGALRIAFKQPRLFPIAAAVAPAIDYQIRYYEDESLTQMYPDPETIRQDTATLHVHPLNWPRNTWFVCDPLDDRWHESAERLHMKMSALGIMHEYDGETSAGGHGWQYYNHMASRAVGYVAERLDQEERRVV
ncbi:MAG TPA: alpha/beta hydrolase-fold protein [Pirellulales bacterium]|nr:alpha/beta hydrolase-fold protein [Pirellulales bacterium]